MVIPPLRILIRRKKNAPTIYLISWEPSPTIRKQWKLGGGFNFQPLLKNISQNGSFPQVGVKITNTWNQYLGSLDPIPPHLATNSLSFPNGHGLFDEFRSGGFRQKSVARFCLADLIFFWKELSSWEKKVGNKTRKLFGKPKNNGRIKKSALEKEREREKIDITLSFVYFSQYLYSYIWWTFIRSWLDQPVLFFEFRISKQRRPLMLPRGVMERMVEWSKALWQNPSKRLQDSEGVLISRLKVLIY